MTLTMKSTRKSRFWPFSLSKLRPRRGSQDSKTSSEDFHSLSSVSPADVIDDQKDGFYRYSESLVEGDSKSLVLRPSPSAKDVASDYFAMAPAKRHSRPYTVSSDEWVIPSPSSSSSASQVLSLDDLNTMQLSLHFGAVLKIFDKIYAVAKILHVTFLAYGVELDDSESGLKYWIERAEAEIRTDSLSDLIELVENLFYTLYSRVQVEMAGIELCALFKVDHRPKTTYKQFSLPDPNHLYRIFLACKDVLDSPLVCETSEAAIISGLVSQYQENHIRRFISKESVKGFNHDDLLGYRRYAINIVSDRSSAYYKKWNQLIPFFDSIPSEVMALISEKYCAVISKEVPEADIPTSELGFVDLKAINPIQWEKEIILDHRMAALGKLEGKTVGEERREDDKVRLLSVVKSHKCICTSVCFCAHECTNDVERWCPCAERHLRIMLAKRRKGAGRFKFTTRANTLARACFQGLANLRRNVSDDQLLIEIQAAFEIFDMEIEKERSGVIATSWI